MNEQKIVNVGTPGHCDYSDLSELAKSIPEHDWDNKSGYKVCKTCGTAKHKKKFEGFKYWYAGVGYESDPGCRLYNSNTEV